MDVYWGFVEMKNDLLNKDRQRYKNCSMPRFQIYYRKCQSTNGILKALYGIIFKLYRRCNLVEIYTSTQIGGGLLLVHPYCITINPESMIGCNCNIHKGVTIGKENRGERTGAPIIGNDVWIGVNASIVGKITIGDDVMIAPNSFVNKDVPLHSIVFGNPCIIKEKNNATEGYINNRVDLL